jgi:hypothetical protein
MFDQLSAEIPASLIKGFLRTTRTRTTTTTTTQNVDPAVHFVYSRVKMEFYPPPKKKKMADYPLPYNRPYVHALCT